MKKISSAKILYMVAAVGILLAAVPTAMANAVSSISENCQNLRLSVALGPNQAKDQTVAADYCLPFSWAAGAHQVDVLSPGATYNHTYWDWPQDPSLYSYVDKTLAAGRATLNYDRIGTGSSSHPPGATITTESDAFVLHQIIGWLGSQGYTQINSIGHSYGSVVAIQEAGTYNDASRLIVTGLLHSASPGFVNLSAFVYPVPLKPGYLTSIPGTRGVFYSSSADPAVIAYDNAHPDVVSATSLATGITALELLPGLNISNRITAPVLLVVGQQDAFFCARPQIVNCSNPSAIKNFETPYYSAAPSVSVASIPNTGHDLTLHPSANVSFSDSNAWIKTH